MTSGTHSPSLNPVHRGFGREVREPNEGFEGINLIADQFALMTRCLRVMAPLNPLIGTINDDITSPMATLRYSITPPMRTFSSAITLLPAEVIGNLVAKSMAAASDSRASAFIDAPVAEMPQVEHRGWRDYIDPAEYETRLEAISPRSANNEAEEHVPPPPRGRGRAIRMR